MEAKAHPKQKDSQAKEALDAMPDGDMMDLLKKTLDHPEYTPGNFTAMMASILEKFETYKSLTPKQAQVVKMHLLYNKALWAALAPKKKAEEDLDDMPF